MRKWGVSTIGDLIDIKLFGLKPKAPFKDYTKTISLYEYDNDGNWVLAKNVPLDKTRMYFNSINYGGYLSRLDHRTGENRAINVWPDNPMGAGADVLKYRFQWNFPIFFSPHNPKKLYCAANVLFSTENEGASWTALSPDLTTNDKTKQGPSGGPITKDDTSVEYYCTIFTATESWVEKDLLWTGSDDGIISVSRDGGKNWENVTPKDAPKWVMCIS